MFALLRRLVGLFLIVGALLGFALSLAAIIYTWNYRQPVTGSLTSSIDLTITTLNTTEDALVVADQSLTLASQNINTLQSTIETTSLAVTNTSPLVDSLITLMSEDLPNTITATQTSLNSARASAQLIESALSVITNLPLIPGDPYRPTVPLHTSLAEVSSSLDPLLLSFSDMESSLRSSKGNLTMIEAEFNIISRQIGDVNSNLTNAQTVMQNYQTVVTDLTTRMENTKSNLPAWISTTAIVLTVFFIWLAVANLGLLFQGLEMLATPNREVVVIEDPDVVHVSTGGPEVTVVEKRENGE